MAIASKQFTTDRLGAVRDIFLFSCFTGLAYADTQKLKKEDVFIGVDGNKWINCKRQKSKSSSRIPLLPVAERILAKYAEDPFCLETGKLLPVKNNQKMNAYLKEIADVCGITKTLTTHIARHTFATTVTLSNKIPIETVSKMLAHQKISTTQEYAKILDDKVSRDMSGLRLKYI
jgi:site-specific recombinase XerD